MAGTSPAMTNLEAVRFTSPRHARLYAGHPRLHDMAANKDVDGRDKPGHDK
jgi:hypothetical protein